MNYELKSIARTITILVAITLVWSMTGGWLPIGTANQVGRASAATLTVQPVWMAPNNAPTLDPKRPASPDAPETAVGTGFTYQGRLMDSNVPANGQFDLRFTLFDAPTAGNQVSNQANLTNQTVASGLFTVSLDFGSNAFYGEPRWLEIAVKPTGGGTFTTLSPRQFLTAAPFSLSTRWEGASNKPFPYNPLRQPNVASSVDLGTNVGYYTSIAIGADGMGLVSYQDGNLHHLKVTHCLNLTCSLASNYIIDASTYIGNYTSLRIGADGLGLISYYDYTNQNLKVAHCSNVACSSASTYTIDSTGSVGDASSVTIGADGLGLISYQDFTNGALKIAHCSNVQCDSATTAAVDTPGTVYYNSITTGADGLSLIAYSGNNIQLKVAHCSNAACSTATITTINAPYYGQNMSVTVGADGLGLVSYVGSGDGSMRLKVVHCSNITCSSYTNTIIDTVTNINYQTSVAIGPDGLGIISYLDYTNADLKVAHCSDVTCSSATTITVDSNGYVGEQSSIAIGVDGLGLISYHDGTNGSLKVLHCASPLCLSYQHKR